MRTHAIGRSLALACVWVAAGDQRAQGAPPAAHPAAPAASSPTSPASIATRARLVLAGDLDRLSQAAAVERAIREAPADTTVEIVFAPARVRIDVAWAMMKALRATDRPTRVHLGLDRLARGATDRGTRPTIHPLALAIALRATERAIDPSARIMGAAANNADDDLIDAEISGASPAIIRGEVQEWFERALEDAPDALFDLLWSPRDVASIPRPLPAQPPSDPEGAMCWRQARLVDAYKDIRTGARISADPSLDKPLRSVIIDAKTLGAMGVIAVAPLGPERDLATHTLVPSSESLAERARNDLAAAEASLRKAQRALDLEDPATRALASAKYRGAIDTARNATRDATRRIRDIESLLDAEPDVAAMAPPRDMALATPAQRRARWRRELQSILDGCAKANAKAASFEEAINAR